MPLDIQGWIEYSPYIDNKEKEDEHSWITWMNIGAIIQFNDEVNWILFGNPRDFQNLEPKYKPIAKNRGFPTNPDSYLKSDIEWLKEFESKNGKGDSFGFSYFYFSEIEMIDWEKEYGVSLIYSDWKGLFELTIKFKELKNIQSDQIRFTVWYNWQKKGYLQQGISKSGAEEILQNFITIFELWYFY